MILTIMIYFVDLKDIVSQFNDIMGLIQQDKEQLKIVKD